MSEPQDPPLEPGAFVSLEDLETLQRFVNACSPPAGATNVQVAQIVLAISRWREEAQAQQSDQKAVK